MFDVVRIFSCIDACRGNPDCSGGVIEDRCGLLRCKFLSWAIGGVLVSHLDVLVKKPSEFVTDTGKTSNFQK